MASSYDILNMDPDQFIATLDELGLPQDQRAALERQYFEAQRLLPMTSRPEGRRIGTILPISMPEGMTGSEALLSGDFEFTVPELLRGLYEAPAEAINVGSAMLRGVPVTRDQILETAMTVGAAGVGPRPMARKPKVGEPEAPAPAAEPDMWEGVEPDAGFIDVEDIDWDEDVIDQMNNAMLRREGLLPPENRYTVRPAIGQQEGIAGLYSPTRKAIDLLDRPSYDNLDSLRVQLLNRGAKPDEVERVISRARNEMDEGPMSKERLASLADEAAGDIVVSTRTLDTSPRDNPMFLTDDYFLRGAEDIGANVIELATGPNGRAPDAAFDHFTSSAEDRVPLLHTRFGMVYSKGASDAPDTYHLGEIQSDWAQTRAKLPLDNAALQKLDDEFLDLDNKIQSAMDQYRNRRDKIMAEMGREPPREGEIVFGEDPELEDAFAADPEHRRLLQQYQELIDQQRKVYDRRRLSERYGTRDEFDANFPAPYVGTTSKWVQLALRQSLIDAVNRGARQMSLSTGKMARGYTGGKEKGQDKFYDEIVPKELDAVLKKFAKEAGIQKPEIEMDLITTGNGSSFTAPVLRFSDEFIDAVKRIGLPAYAKGGIVKGSYLDVDPLEPAIR